jgi:hypothetical protein
MSLDPRQFGCRELNQYLFDYVERTLDERMLIALDNHLLVCTECEQLKESYERTTQTAKVHMTQAISRLSTAMRDRLVNTLNNVKADE